MAWARLAPSGGHCHTMPAPVMNAAAPDCHQHQAAARDHAQPNHPLPCCDGGSCACAASSAPAVAWLAAPGDLRHDTNRVPLITRDVAPDPLDDTLRPPIR